MKNLINKIKLFSIGVAAFVFLSGCGYQKPRTEVKMLNTNSNTSTSSNISKDEIHSGLLLGLVTEPNLDNKNVNNTDFENKVVEKYRTLWIYGDGSNIEYSEKKNVIITPYGDKFLKLTNNSIVIPTTAEKLNGASDNFYSKYSSYYNFSVIVSQSANETKNLLNKDSLNKNYFSNQEGDVGSSFISRTETILYAGNKYASVKTSQYATGGGTFKSSYDDIKLYDIKDLATLGTKRPNVALKSLLGNDVDANLQPLTEKYNKTNTSNQLVKDKNVIDDTNLALKRFSGKWTVKAPLYEVYTHMGNGSNYNIITNFYDTNIDVPKSITSYDSLCIDWNTIKNKIPKAKDAVSSPNKDTLVVLTPSELEIFVHPEQGIDKPIRVIPVDNSEKIVLNQWATGAYVGTWTKALSSY